MSEKTSEKMQELRETLKKVEELTSYLTINGVTLNYHISSEQKTVDVKTTSVFSIEVKGNVNQEI